MIIDGLILATLVLSALIAFFRGFVREVLTLFGLVGALAVAWFAAPFVQPYAQELIGNNPDGRLFGLIPYPVAADVGAFAAVFLATLILLTLAAHAISHGLHAVGLGSVDRILGVLFGLIRGLVLVLLFYMPFYFTASAEQKQMWYKESAMLPLIDMVAETIEPLLPRHDDPVTKEDVKEVAEDAKEKGEQGFGKLDALMRQALEPGQEPDVIGETPSGGYQSDANDGMNELIEKETP